jgi:hypothetical protein
LWSTVFSPGTGTLAWTSIVENLATLEATDAKLMADAQYLDLVNEGAGFVSGDAIDDGIVQLLATEVDPTGTPPAYVNVVRAVLAAGAMASGIELGIEISQRAKKITGCPCSFGVAGTGVYGGIVWITGCDSVEQLESSQQAIAADAEFTKLIDKKASDLYLPGVTTQTIYRRIV